MGKQSVLDAYHGKRTETVPWVPYVGVHGAFLLGERADRYLQSPELMAKGVLNAAKQYQADGITFCFDLQIEAMAMGCEVKWFEDNTPAVTNHPLTDQPLKKANLRIPTAKDGRWPTLIEAGKRVKDEIGDVALLGLLCGPITLGAHLKGVKLFTDLYKNPEEAKEIIDFAGEVGAESARIYSDIGCDVIVIVDPTASLVRPEIFNKFVTPACQPALKVIHEAGLTSSYWS
jgi:uroporphyrinogen decarboxylase